MRKLASVVNHLEEGLMAFFLASMTVLTAVQVLLRYAFNTGLIWSLEATTYSFAWLVLLGMSYGVRTRSHITVDFLVDRLGPQKRRIARLVAVAVCLVYALLMLYGGFEFVRGLYSLGHRARDLPVARWLLTIILPVGFALLSVRLVQLGLETWRGQVAPGAPTGPENRSVDW